MANGFVLLLYHDSSDDVVPTRRWIGTIEGPKDTIYQGLKFKLTLDFTTKYPYVAPAVQFVTTCFHPNVDSEGNICLDILKVRAQQKHVTRTT